MKHVWTTLLILTLPFIALAQGNAVSTHGSDTAPSGSNSPTAHSSLSEDDVNAAALAETQQVLSDPTKRIEVIKVSQDGKKIDDQVKELMGENSEEMYRTASDFLPYILQVGRGDPTKMAELLTQAKRDPASFANGLPNDLKQKIKNLSEKVKPLPEQRKP